MCLSLRAPCWCAHKQRPRELPTGYTVAALSVGWWWLSRQGPILWGYQWQAQCPGRAILTVRGYTQWRVCLYSAWSIPPWSRWPWLPVPLSLWGMWNNSWQGLGQARRDTFPPHISPLPTGLVSHPHLDKTLCVFAFECMDQRVVFQINFYWSMVTLQCWVTFYCTVICIHIFPLLGVSFPFRSIQKTD